MAMLQYLDLFKSYWFTIITLIKNMVYLVYLRPLINCVIRFHLMHGHLINGPPLICDSELFSQLISKASHKIRIINNMV